MTTFRYVLSGSRIDVDTRHKAVGLLAKHDYPAETTIVPVRESALGRLHDEPKHLGNQYFSDRDYFATTHGAVRVEREATVRMRNGQREETIASHWEAKCPCCWRTHKTDDGDEASRGNLLDLITWCCEAEWMPPSDWVGDCDICGDSHRGEFSCSPISYRDPFPGVDSEFECARCGWSGEGGRLRGAGACPECDSGAVGVAP